MREKPKRFRGAKAPAKIASIENHIEKTYKLPRGSVKICNPDGTDARGNKKIESLKRDYN
jgi:hypothetical protein